MVAKDQGLRDDGPGAKSGTLPVLVNAFILETSHVRVLCMVYGCFPAPQAKWSRCNRDLWLAKSKLSPGPSQKTLLTPATDC